MQQCRIQYCINVVSIHTAHHLNPIGVDSILRIYIKPDVE